MEKKISSRERCKSTLISIQGFESSTDLLVVPLGDSQVILGTVWLKGLGPTLWDFSKNFIVLKEGKHLVSFKEVDIVEGRLLTNMLQGDGLFATIY